MAVERVAVGALLAGKYEVLHPVGEGAMGSVWAVRNRLNDRECALKFVRPSEVSGPEHRERLLREARASGRIAHRNVVAVYDVGELEDGSPFLVMELLRGEALDVASRRRRLPLREALSVMADASRGVAAAHAVGVVHRDLKPGNIFLHRDPDGSTVVKVIDFGVSKVLSAERATSSMTGLSIGSPAYMSPEQARGARAIDARADLWAIGVVLFELASGRLPFEGETPYDTVAQILLGEIPRLRERCPEVDPALDELIARCLQRDPGLRPQSAEELVAALDALSARLALPAAEAVAVSCSQAEAASAPPERADDAQPLLAPRPAEEIAREERTEPAREPQPLLAPRRVEEIARDEPREPAHGTYPQLAPWLVDASHCGDRPAPASAVEPLGAPDPTGHAPTEPPSGAPQDASRRTTSPATLTARRLAPLASSPPRHWVLLGALGGAAALALGGLWLRRTEEPRAPAGSARATDVVSWSPGRRAEAAPPFFRLTTPGGACSAEGHEALPTPLLLPLPSPRCEAAPEAAPGPQPMSPRVVPVPPRPSARPVAPGPRVRPVEAPAAAVPRRKGSDAQAPAHVTRPTRGKAPSAPPAKTHDKKTRPAPSAPDELELGRRR